MTIITGFELAARYSQFANVNSLFANAKSSILRMILICCKNNVQRFTKKVDFHNHFECILLPGVSKKSIGV